MIMIDKVGMMQRIINDVSCISWSIFPRSGSCLSFIAIYRAISLEKEELSTPISEIKDKATELGDHWLMCPLCQESWEEHSVYGMVRCPKCNHKLHNPQFKS